MTQTSHPAHTAAFLKLFQEQRARAAADPCLTFTAAASVTLADWRDLDEATCWCILRHRGENRLYRRTINAGAYTATFEFDIVDSDVVWFKLRYGSA